ncbi:LysR family transcriptional regulator [Simiduia litorea]|uniref:LysR family transcriptional regulator n=1 Tax=Simiduia litorea TaxID=1435348 RepID=UPI0036F22759
MNIRNFDLNLLVVLDALLRERNVSKAADKLSLTQPAISNALNRLRTQLDDEVMIRTAGGMKPTALALSLEEPVRRALRQIESSLNSNLAFDPSLSNDVFTLALTDFVEHMLMPSLSALLAQVAPGLQLRVVDLGRDFPLQALESGQVDLAIGRFLNLPSRASHRRWLEEDLVLVSALTNRMPENLDVDSFCALRHLWVSGAQTKGMVDAWLEAHGYSRELSYITPNYMMASHLVAATDMVVVLPRRFAQKYQRLLPLCLYEMPMTLDTFSIDMAWASLRDKDKGLQWLVEQLLTIDVSA